MATISFQLRPAYVGTYAGATIRYGSQGQAYDVGAALGGPPYSGTITLDVDADAAKIEALRNHPAVYVTGSSSAVSTARTYQQAVVRDDGAIVPMLPQGGYGGLVPASRLSSPAIRTIGLIGVSTEQNCGTAEPLDGPYTETGTNLADYGYLSYAIQAMGWRAPRFIMQGGVSGNTSADILSRLPALLADPAKIPDCIICGSGLFGNDFTGLAGTGGNAVPSVAQGQANMKAILDACVATGAIVVIATAQHHDTAPTPITDGLTYQQYQATQNAYLRRYAERNPRVLVLDIERITADAITGKWRTGGRTGDGLHPYRLGAYEIGMELAAMLGAFLPTDQGPANGLDAGNLLGLTGFIQGAVPTFVIPSFTGTLPTQWGSQDYKGLYTVNGQVVGGQFSLVDRGDGKGNWLKVKITSPGVLRLYVSAATGAIATGDVFRGAIEYKTDAADPLVNLREFGAFCVGAGTNLTCHNWNNSHAAADATAGRPTQIPSAGVLRCQRALGAAGVAAVAVNLSVVCWADSGTFYLSRAMIRKND